MPWTGQWAEDEWIYNRLFHNKRGGFYVEMGAMVGRFKELPSGRQACQHDSLRRYQGLLRRL